MPEEPAFEELEKRIAVLEQELFKQKWTEEILREDAEKFHAFFRTCPDALAINRLEDGEYIDVNEAYTENGFLSAYSIPISPPRKSRGEGLGLATVQNIIKSHNGDIEVKSEPNKGTVFEIYLPMIAETGTGEEIEPMDEFKKGFERILVVDDETAIADLEKEILKNLGYRVIRKTNSVEAFDLFSV